MGNELETRGRPPRDLTPEEEDKVLEAALEGKAAEDIRKTVGIGVRTFFEYRQRCESFKTKYAQARNEGLEELGDKLLKIIEIYPDAQQARVVSDNIKWVLSRRKPEVYGDRIDMNVNHHVDIGTALAEARSRVASRQLSNGSTDEKSNEIKSLPVKCPKVDPFS